MNINDVLTEIALPESKEPPKLKKEVKINEAKKSKKIIAPVEEEIPPYVYGVLPEHMDGLRIIKLSQPALYEKILNWD